MQALNWKLNHHIVTVNTWVNTYMQLGSHHLRPSVVKAREFEYPAYSCLEFIRVMQLLDLCMLDIASRQFSSSVLAASAVYLVSERSRAHLEVITGERERKILETLLSSLSLASLSLFSSCPIIAFITPDRYYSFYLFLPSYSFCQFISLKLPLISLRLFLCSSHPVTLSLLSWLPFLFTFCVRSHL